MILPSRFRLAEEPSGSSALSTEPGSSQPYLGFVRSELREVWDRLLAWWPPRQPWRRRAVEWLTLFGSSSDRTTALLLLAPIMTILMPPLVAQPEDRAVAWMLPWLLALDVVTVKALDRRLEIRIQLESLFVSGAVVAEARRYGLQAQGDVEVDDEWRALLMVRRPTPGRRRADSVGRLFGEVRGRDVAVMQFAARRGDFDLAVIGVVSLRRSVEQVSITPKYVSKRVEEEHFEDRFSVKGSGARALPADVKEWIFSHAQTFSYEASGRLLACRSTAVQVLDAPTVGVLLAALIEVAQRLDASVETLA